ncbi:carbonyl reductase [NADPH] 1-like, partial [Otolemur garnettii]|uniref:carbonyl reductase [NADPH] 1-like n=1 Tax=Otolemur garnettii TaxID=30611 RepID=UPI0006440E3B
MSSGSRVALVTGANKGIGLAIVRDLCRHFSGDVVLTARDPARGQAAVQQLQAEGLSPRFHQLDIDDPQSIRALRDFLRREYGGLDVLVNNAGIVFQPSDPTPFHVQAHMTMKTNFFGTRDVCTELLPLVRPQGECDGSSTPRLCTGMLPLPAWLSLQALLLPTLQVHPAAHCVPTLPSAVFRQDLVVTSVGAFGALCPSRPASLGSFLSQ